jgi:mannitol-specific phosphotransferase system IIBC component
VEETMAKSVAAKDVKKIVFACEAGMGSSLIGANQLKKKLKTAGLEVEVEHSPARDIPKDAQIVIAHEGLAKVAREQAPWAVVIAFSKFVGNPVYDQLVKALQSGVRIAGAE